MPTRLRRLSGKEHLILEMLAASSSRECYGLELVGISGGSLVRGTVFVTLNRMEEKGLIVSRQEAPGPGVRGIPRRLYRMTGHGARRLGAHRQVIAASNAGITAVARR